jgi:hypothetical protein
MHINMMKPTGKSLQIFVASVPETDTSMYCTCCLQLSGSEDKHGNEVHASNNLACLQYQNIERQFIVKSCLPKLYLKKTLMGTQQKVKFMMLFRRK